MQTTFCTRRGYPGIPALAQYGVFVVLQQADGQTGHIYCLYVNTMRRCLTLASACGHNNSSCYTGNGAHLGADVKRESKAIMTIQALARGHLHARRTFQQR